ncbi:tyrosine-type recombinase/integrase [Paenibacillus paeoniae]|uniref:tyrosine-type recombinase/integrase n=1 Tax=Paenibacillus paeoniae TaxID=2292705 RepID=UPI001F0BB6AC|nr:tyrosine-type recombinase/integrase [Paenibacillus paeoniae]
MAKENITITRITPHGLRHTHATILINKGIPPFTIPERLGYPVKMIYKVMATLLKLSCL